jgi:hypothetical protein
MPADFQFDVFLSRSAKDKAVVRKLGARLQRDGVRVWSDEEQINPAHIADISKKYIFTIVISCNRTDTAIKRPYDTFITFLNS